MERQSRKSGIDVIGDVPWGTHICQFYQTKEDLMEILVTYFKAGLENDEFCLWVTSQPVEVEDAKNALRKAIPDFNIYLAKGQIEIIPYTHWYMKEGVFDLERVLNGWVEKLNLALANGHNGLRLTGNTFWLENGNWDNFVDYEEKVDRVLGNYKMIALCTYCLNRHNADEIIDVVANHQFALIKRDGKWKRIESSKRKHAEAALREGEERLRFALETSQIGAWDLDLVDHTAYRSLDHDRIFGYDQLLPQWTYEMFLDHVLPEDRAMVDSKFREATATRSDWNFECRIRRVDGAARWIWAAGRHRVDASGSVRRMAGIVQDITERKQLEEQTRQQAEEMTRVMEVAPVSILIGHDPQCHNITGNRTSNELYEAEIGENISANATAVRRYFFKGRELTADELPMQESALKDIDVHNAELDVLLPSGEWRRLLGSASPLHDTEGHVRGSIGAFMDITERKRAEDALRESEKRERAHSVELAAILDAVPVAVYISHDPQVLQITGNRLSYEWLRIPAGTNLSKSAPKGERPEMFKLFKNGVEIPPAEMPSQRAAAGIMINDCELDIVSADGEIRHVLGNARPLRDEQGNLRGSISAFIDITGRKKAEEALKQANDNLENLVKERTVELEQAYKSLKESEKGLAEAQRMAHIGNWEWNRVTGETYWSDELYRIFERCPQESAATYSELLNYIHPHDRDYVCSVIKKGLTGETTGIDYRIILANGEERTVHAQAEVTFDEKNVPVRVKGIAQDITERKKAEQAIELSEERYRIITEQTGQLVYDYSLEEDTADWAGNIEELTGYTPDEFRGMNLKFWLSCIHPEDQNTLLEKYGECLVSGETYRMEYRFRIKNGEYIYFEDNGIFLRDKKGNANRVLGAVKDITERKKAEMFVANVETARKKEIHHRIKNNLQVISSLLDLQSEKFRNRKSVEDSEVLNAFRESQDRVMSIALIHEELHEGKGTDKLNFSPYLKRLVNSLFQTYRLGNSKTSLNIELEENIFFDMDIAVPLGIIINELVSNSLKYAFSGKDSGLIQIKLCREKSTEHADSGSGNRSDNKQGSKEESYNNSSFVLRVSDNGIGIPENFNSENSDSLGLQLVMILVDQLEGKLELKRNNGTEFTIRFTVK